MWDLRETADITARLRTFNFYDEGRESFEELYGEGKGGAGPQVGQGQGVGCRASWKPGNCLGTPASGILPLASRRDWGYGLRAPSILPPLLTHPQHPHTEQEWRELAPTVLLRPMGERSTETPPHPGFHCEPDTPLPRGGAQREELTFPSATLKDLEVRRGQS